METIKSEYTTPEIQVILFTTVDVMTASDPEEKDPDGMGIHD